MTDRDRISASLFTLRVGVFIVMFMWTPWSRAAQLFSLAQKMSEFGIDVQTRGINWASAVGRKDRLVLGRCARTRH